MTKFTYGMDPDDRVDTPEDIRRMNDLRFYLWQSTGVKPETITDKAMAEAYAAYLKANTQ
jgi:hypothetical protein